MFGQEKSKKSAVALIIAICATILVLCLIYLPNMLQQSPNWRKLAAGYQQPNIDYLLYDLQETTIDANGNITIEENILRSFNRFANEYAFFFLPEVDWYQFHSVYDNTPGYDSNGAAVMYFLFVWDGKFAHFPDKAPKLEMEARIRKLFAAPNDQYPAFPHKEYPKFAQFDGKNYSHVPTEYHENQMVYELLNIKIEKKDGYRYYTAIATQYGFDVAGNYEPGLNELLLAAKSKQWQCSQTEALDRMLTNGQIREATPTQLYTVLFRVVEHGSYPQFCQIEKGVPYYGQN